MTPGWKAVLVALDDLSARSRATQFIVDELLRHAADEPDGAAVLARLFERVSARIDGLEENDEVQKIAAAIRSHVERPFAQIAALRAERDREPD